MALTDIDKQAAQSSPKGGPTEFAPAPGDGSLPSPTSGAGGEYKVAGLLTSFFNAMKPRPVRPDSALAKQGVAKRVPTTMEERITYDQPGFSYSETQKHHAGILSEEGQARFAAQGQKAAEPPTEVDQVIDEARYAVKADDANWTLNKERGPTEGVADRILSAAEKAKATLKTGEDGFLDFNFNNLDTGDDVKALIAATAKIYKDPTEAAKRGIRTNIETEEAADKLLADELGFTRELLKKRPGGVMNAEEMTAVRKLMVRSAERLERLSGEIEAGGAAPEVLLAFRRQLAIHAGIQMQAKSAQTEIARALQAFRIPVGADVGPMREEILSMLASSGGSEMAVKLAKGYRKAVKEGGRVGGNKFAEAGWATKAEGVFHEVYINGLLSWTTTQFKNFFATPLWMTYQLGEDVLAGVWGTAIRTVRPKSAEGVYLGEALMRVRGWSESMHDAWVIANKAFKTEVPADALSKLESMQFKQIDAERLGLSGWTGQSVDWLGKVIRLPGRFLVGADEFWKAISQRGELFAQAYNKAAVAKRMGASDQDALDDGLMVLLDPRAKAGEMDAAARYNTLPDDLGSIGVFTTAIQKVPLFGRMLLPFAKIPTNAIRRVFERHPMFMPLNPKAWKDASGKNGAVAQQRFMGRLSATAGTMYLVGQMAMEGRLTGSMPRDEKQRRMLPPNWRPYSLVLKGENWPKDNDGDDLPLLDRITGLYNGPDTNINYAGLEPVGAFFGIVANTIERARRVNDPTQRENLFTAAAFSTVDYFNQIPFLQGMSSIMTTMRTQDISHLTNSPMGNMIAGTPFPAPFSAAQRNINKSLDPAQTRASFQVPLYTLKDVQNMELGPDGMPRYDLVGLPKGDVKSNFQKILLETWAVQTKNSLVFGNADSKALQFDVLGNPKQTSVRFDMNPVKAAWNLITPIHLTEGEAPTALHKELVRLGMPLTTKREKLRGIRLSEKQQTIWTDFAKNKIMLSPGPGLPAMPFREALWSTMTSHFYVNGNQKMRANIIKNLEKKFYDRAIPGLLLSPGSEELSQVYHERKLLQGQGLVK